VAYLGLPRLGKSEVRSFHRHFFLRHSSSYRCAVTAARSRAAATTNLACLSLALVLRAIFGGKSCALVNVFMTCPRWSAGGQPTTKLCPRSRRPHDKERPHLRLDRFHKKKGPAEAARAKC
jgi:hypothetical protein